MSLADKDRIFTNVYGFQPWNLDAATARGDWDDTRALMLRGQDAIIDVVKASGLRGRGGAGRRRLRAQEQAGKQQGGESGSGRLGHGMSSGSVGCGGGGPRPRLGADLRKRLGARLEQREAAREGGAAGGGSA